MQHWAISITGREDEVSQFERASPPLDLSALDAESTARQKF